MREPTNDEQRLMIIGDFDTLEDYLEWMNTPLSPEELAKLEEPDLVEDALEAMREEFGEEFDDDEMDGEETEFMPI